MFDDQYHSLQKQKIYDLLQKNVLSGSEVAAYLNISLTNLPSLIARKKLVPFYTFNLENDYKDYYLFYKNDVENYKEALDFYRKYRRN